VVSRKAPIRGRVLSANSRGTRCSWDATGHQLALSQGRADLFALRPPWRPFAATRPRIYADGRRGGTCRRAAQTCSRSARKQASRAALRHEERDASHGTDGPSGHPLLRYCNGSLAGGWVGEMAVRGRRAEKMARSAPPALKLSSPLEGEDQGEGGT